MSACGIRLSFASRQSFASHAPLCTPVCCAGRSNGGTSSDRTLLLMHIYNTSRHPESSKLRTARSSRGARILPVCAPCPRRKNGAVHDARRAASPATPQHPSSGGKCPHDRNRVNRLPALSLALVKLALLKLALLKLAFLKPARRHAQSACLRRKAGMSYVSTPFSCRAATCEAAVSRVLRHTAGVSSAP